MRHRTGQNRQQFGLFATPLDEMIAADNMVRVVDAFVDAIDLEKLGFVHVRAQQRGAPSYHPGLLLKVYIYGSLNRVRPSRWLHPLVRQRKSEREYSLVLLACNMRRAMSISGVSDLIKRVKRLFFRFSGDKIYQRGK